ncbi:uncharacterized protein BcabD6B2_14170 [Babesia caballi]|uniref:Uncharacterized protein n=1 Tax=Babesia caballi TaxID=5871 RepID=A0AAV4LQC1_BABCB|nr:hypothetical protein BcabD6B2_14170 [Babesia caballi]
MRYSRPTDDTKVYRYTKTTSLLQTFLVLLRARLLVRRVHRLVHLELHGELALPLGRSAEVSDVPEHVPQRHVRLQNDVGAVRRRVGHQTLALGYGGQHGRLKLVRSHHLHLHYRLQNNGVRVHVALLEGALGSELEGNVGRVHLVRLAVVHHDARVHHLATAEQPLPAALAEPALDGGDVVRGDVVANQLVDELDVQVAVHLLADGLQVPDDLAVLAGSAGLALVRVREVHPRSHGLAVVHNGRPRLNGEVVLPLHALDVDPQVELPHAAQNGLLALLVHGYAERRVLALEPV